MQEDIIIQISKHLKIIRKEKYITLQQLAEEASVTKSMLSQVENSRSIPSLTVLLNLIKALQIDFNEFFRDINLQPKDSKVIFKKSRSKLFAAITQTFALKIQRNHTNVCLNKMSLLPCCACNVYK